MRGSRSTMPSTRTRWTRHRQARRARANGSALRGCSPSAWWLRLRFSEPLCPSRIGRRCRFSFALPGSRFGDYRRSSGTGRIAAGRVARWGPDCVRRYDGRRCTRVVVKTVKRHECAGPARNRRRVVAILVAGQPVYRILRRAQVEADRGVGRAGCHAV